MTIDTEIAISLERRFASSPDKVFAAWTTPEVLKQWWKAGPEGWETPTANVDLKVGGLYELTMRDPEGNDHTVRGEFREINPPTRLAYTWAWNNAPVEIHPKDASLVTVNFAPDGDGTLVTLAHTGFDTENQRDMHVHGWEGCLANLERALS